jgi:hypothetical protein
VCEWAEWPPEQTSEQVSADARPLLAELSFLHRRSVCARAIERPARSGLGPCGLGPLQMADDRGQCAKRCAEPRSSTARSRLWRHAPAVFARLGRQSVATGRAPSAGASILRHRSHESRLSPTASREGRCRRELETRTSSRHGHQRVNMHLCSRRRPRCAARFDWRSRCRSTVHEISSGPREISSGPAVDHVARLARRRVGDTVRREPPGNALPPRQPQPR